MAKIIRVTPNRGKGTTKAKPKENIFNSDMVC
jgi:hypothetical protein